MSVPKKMFLKCRLELGDSFAYKKFEPFYDDREMVLLAVSKVPLKGDKTCPLDFVDRKFQKDKEIVLKAIENYGGIFWSIDVGLRNEKDVALALIKKSPVLFTFLGPDMKKDIEINLAVLEHNKQARVMDMLWWLISAPEEFKVAAKCDGFVCYDKLLKYAADNEWEEIDDITKLELVV